MSLLSQACDPSAATTHSDDVQMNSSSRVARSADISPAGTSSAPASVQVKKATLLTMAKDHGAGANVSPMTLSPAVAGATVSTLDDGHVAGTAAIAAGETFSAQDDVNVVGIKPMLLPVAGVTVPAVNDGPVAGIAPTLPPPPAGHMVNTSSAKVNGVVGVSPFTSPTAAALQSVAKAPLDGDHTVTSFLTPNITSLTPAAVASSSTPDSDVTASNQAIVNPSVAAFSAPDIPNLAYDPKDASVTTFSTQAAQRITIA